MFGYISSNSNIESGEPAEKKPDTCCKSDFYKSPKWWKKTASALGGLGVAISTATSLTVSTASWIANLVAIVSGGSGYSSFKNLETADLIETQISEVRQLAEQISLQKYQAILKNPIITKILEDPAFNDTNLNANITTARNSIAQLDNLLNDSKWLATINLGAQATLGLIVVISNIIANLEASDARKTDFWETKNIFNLLISLICIGSQYAFHIGYVAKNLREIATTVEKLKLTLLDIQKNPIFRALELLASLLYISRLKKDIQNMEIDIKKIRQEADELAIERKHISSVLDNKMQELLANENNRIALFAKFELASINLDNKTINDNEIIADIDSECIKNNIPPKDKNALIQSALVYRHTLDEQDKLKSQIKSIDGNLEEKSNLVETQQKILNHLIAYKKNSVDLSNKLACLIKEIDMTRNIVDFGISINILQTKNESSNIIEDKTMNNNQTKVVTIEIKDDNNKDTSFHDSLGLSEQNSSIEKIF